MSGKWWDWAWNPVTGCSPASVGCANCYAKRAAEHPRLRGKFGYPEDEPFRVTLRPDRFSLPLDRKKPLRIFVNSMGDLFHPDVPQEFINHVFWSMAMAPQHLFFVCTKRHERLVESMEQVHRHMADVNFPAPLPNVMGMVTAENQEMADARIPELLRAGFALRGVSVEPMLGPVDMVPGPLGGYFQGEMLSSSLIDWVICGAETGPGKRAFDPAWAQVLAEDCATKGVPFWFKQGERGRHELSGKVFGAMPKVWDSERGCLRPDGKGAAENG